MSDKERDDMGRPDEGHDAEPSNEQSAHTTPAEPTEAELDAMSRDELVKLGTERDGVDVAYRRERFPVPGTRAEKRAERAVSFWFAVSGIAAAVLVGVFLFWPWEFK